MMLLYGKAALHFFPHSGTEKRDEEKKIRTILHHPRTRDKMQNGGLSLT